MERDAQSMREPQKGSDIASEYPNSIFGKRVVPSIGFEENVRNVLGLAAKFLPLGRNLVLLQTGSERSEFC